MVRVMMEKGEFRLYDGDRLVDIFPRTIRGRRLAHKAKNALINAPVKKTKKKVTKTVKKIIGELINKKTKKVGKKK